MLPAPYSVVIVADAGLNPDRQQRSTPVQVRLYELKDPSSFQTADFFALYEKDDQVLGTDVVSREQFTMQPGQSRTLLRKTKAEARTLGVFVAFRDVEKSIWRTTAALPQGKEVGRFAIFSPSFEASVINVRIAPNAVSASMNSGEVPVKKPERPRIDLPSVPGSAQGQTPWEIPR